VKCVDCRDLLQEYALGVLDTAEAGQVRSHLATGCPQCAAALAEAEVVMAHLPLALPPVAPPPAIREQLMRRIAAEPQPLRFPASSSASAPPRPLGPVAPAGPRPGWLLPLAWAASLAIAVGAALLWSSTRTADHAAELAMHQQHEDQLASSQADLAERLVSMQKFQEQMQARLETLASLNQQLTTSMAEASTENRQLSASLATARETIGMLRSSDLKLVSLDAAGTQPKVARARALWDKDTQHWQLIVTGMAQPKKGRTFELWVVTEKGQKVGLGVFDVDAQGNAVLTVTVPKDIGPISMAAVTDEPGMMIAPTGDYHLAGKL
jgi:anti-sigma-K factor RskA